MTTIKAYIFLSQFVAFKKELIKRKYKLSETLVQYECKMFSGYGDLPDIISVIFETPNEVATLFNNYKIQLP